MQGEITLEFLAAASSWSDISHVNRVKSATLFTFTVHKAHPELDSRDWFATTILVININSGRHRSFKRIQVQIATHISDINGTLIFPYRFTTKRSNLLTRLSVYRIRIAS